MRQVRKMAAYTVSRKLLQGEFFTDPIPSVAGIGIMKARFGMAIGSGSEDPPPVGSDGR